MKRQSAFCRTALNFKIRVQNGSIALFTGASQQFRVAYVQRGSIALFIGASQQFRVAYAAVLYCTFAVMKLLYAIDRTL